MSNYKDWAQKELSRVGIQINGTRAFDVTINDERVYRRVGFGGSYCLGNTYVEGMWDCDALDEFFDRTSRAKLHNGLSQLRDYVALLRSHIFNTQSVRRSLEVGRIHYDLGNDLYERMLGPSMAYSSAYFGGGANTLEDAQFAKFEKICTALCLKRGDRVLEIGCGWGTFARFAAEKYGVHVVGISVSQEQLKYAEEHRGSTQNEFHFLDYRHLPGDWRGSFDAAVSIEMIEAVGPNNLRTFFKSAHSALKEDGHFMLQAIIGGGVPDLWLSTHIFPNGVLPSIQQLGNSTQGIFDMRKMETFGSDYDQTLMEWHRRFDSSWDEIRGIKNADGSIKYDETFRRMWRYYLLQCAGIFRSRHIDVAHILLARRG